MKNPIKVTFILLLALTGYACSRQNGPATNTPPTADASANVAPSGGEAPSPAVALPEPSSQDAQGLYALGMELYKQNRDEQAAEAFRQATVLDPKFALAFMKLGLA